LKSTIAFCRIMLSHDNHDISSSAMHQGTLAAAAKFASQSGVFWLVWFWVIVRRNVAANTFGTKIPRSVANKEQKR